MSKQITAANEELERVTMQTARQIAAKSAPVLRLGKKVRFDSLAFQTTPLYACF